MPYGLKLSITINQHKPNMTSILNQLPLFLGNIRGWQLVIILVVVLLLFGGKKIPELMKGLGKGVHSFKQGLEEAKQEMNKPVDKADKEETSKDADKAVKEVSKDKE